MEAFRPYCHGHFPHAVQTLSGTVFPRACLVCGSAEPHMGQSGHGCRNRRHCGRLCVDHENMLLPLHRAHRGDGVAGRLRHGRSGGRNQLCLFDSFRQIFLSVRLFSQAGGKVRTVLRSAVCRHGPPCSVSPDQIHMGLSQKPGQGSADALLVSICRNRRNDTGPIPFLPYG